MSIMSEIVGTRRERIAREGAALGVEIPADRQLPVVPFGRDPFVICEIKRRSPSRGAIAPELDSSAQAARYVSEGAKTLSVLTEENHFGGSLSDLMTVKKRHPDISVLRKDFLLSIEDVDISYRAGADAVLLIAGILDRDTLRSMYTRARSLGMSALVEVHSKEEIEKVAPIAPELTGINARDLSNFTVDLALPLGLRMQIEWSTRLVFESGIHSYEHAAYAAGNGFAGILVGEAVVRRPELIGELIRGLANPQTDFWLRLYSRRRAGRPLVKVCGLTNARDALLADELGADLLGFIFAPSKRRARPQVVREIGQTRAQKVAVVVLDGLEARIEAEVEALLREGTLDAVQFHGDERPEQCYELAFPYYKALQLKQPDEAAGIDSYRCPRVLVDAHSDHMRGGTGKRVDPGIIAAVRRKGALWLAGGIGPENVYETIRAFSPELVDASSALEREPGIKDPEKLHSFFQEIDRAATDGIPYDTGRP